MIIKDDVFVLKTQKSKKSIKARAVLKRNCLFLTSS